ncbi:ABC transporter substrate-binding protein [Actinomadura decatromicini]|uniref:ABC transporter substrate-binding protein n=1 Tax=Actinomadura decatromicini TaxID=2604572 RepID=A0A5D3FWU1_9ACTN|nr:ABC transporter substrate-binding protein [Actinomadura decatromicini]TYK52469.1 ABC transporter substrate-binding protein [Actinomadura decatromicini]
MNPAHAKRAIALLGAAAVLSTAASACGSGEAAESGAFTFATDQVPQCLDPAVSPQDVVALIGRNIFDSLVAMAPDGQLRPWLAEKWTVSPDGKTYTFTLRQGVTFSDGTPLNAAAVKASLDHIVDPRTKSIYAARLISAFDEATAADERTVRIRLKRRSTPFLQALSTTYLGIQSPSSLQAPGAACTRPVGSGPFRLDGWTHNVSLTLKRNPKYAWGPPTAAHTGPARLNRITVKFVTEDAARFGALTSGQVDAIDDVPPVNVKTLKASSGLRLAHADIPGVVFTTFLNASRGPLSDERVRTALVRSVDLDALVRSAYFGQFERAWSVLSPSTLGYDSAAPGTWKYDPALAGRLLDEAGWTARDAQGYRTKGGKPLELRWPYVPQFLAKFLVVAQGIQAQAKQAGFKIDLTPADSGTFGREYVKGDLDLYSSSFVRDEPDILRLFFTSAQSSAKGGGAILGSGFPQLDRWLNEAESSDDQTARVATYVRVQRFVTEHALALPGYVPADLVGYSSKVKGLSFEPNAYPLFYDVTVGGKA